MTDKTEAQPEALRLAARLDCDATNADMGRKPIACTRRRAAAELRRLHAEIQQRKAREHELEQMHDHSNLVVDAAKEHIASLEAQLSARQAAPDGWRPVPVEPTEEMLMAYSANPCNAAQAVAVYRAMLSAAPPPPEREPLSETEVRGLLESAGYWPGEDAQRADFINGLRYCEMAHGIGATND